jgi:hypothetical protein
MAIGSELRLALIGTWLLDSYVEIDHETGAQDHPLGVTPQGIIMYTPDGYMSAQLQKSSRRPFVGGDLYEGEPSEYTEAGRTYIAYSGRFFLDEQSKTISHEMTVSFFPNWTGQTQIRLIELEMDRLHLATDGPQRFNGKLKTANLIWKRAISNG